MTLDFAAAETREKIGAFVRRGEVSRKVVDVLLQQGKMVPQETELWDYKRDLPDLDDSSQAAELVKDIVAFANSLGGYLLFGVAPNANEGDGLEPTGIIERAFDSERLRNVVRNYVGELVQTAYSPIALSEAPAVRLGLLHVAPRSLGLPPLKFQRNGPELSRGKHVFKSGDVYFRFGDECRPAKDPQDWQFLYKEREVLLDGRDPLQRNRVQSSLHHNLPSRA